MRYELIRSFMHNGIKMYATRVIKPIRMWDGQLLPVGALGGFVEHPCTDDSDALIAYGAYVFGTSSIRNNARINMNACVIDSVIDNSVVCWHANVTNCQVHDSVIRESTVTNGIIIGAHIEHGTIRMGGVCR